MSTLAGMTARMTDRGFDMYLSAMALTLAISDWVVRPSVILRNIPGTIIVIHVSIHGDPTDATFSHVQFAMDWGNSEN